jgi:hypothetical protein
LIRVLFPTPDGPQSTTGRTSLLLLLVLMLRLQ